MTAKVLKKSIFVFTAFVLATGLMVQKPVQEVYGAEVGSQTSSNAYLKSLSVDPGTISPEFSPEITSYTITVDEDVDRISVTCSTAEADAKVVEAGGFKNLQPGSNDAVITVQASDGTKCSYNLTINRGTGAVGETGENADEETETPAEETDADDEVSTEVGVVPISMNTETIPVGGDSIYAPFQVNATFPQGLIPEGFTAEDYNYKGNMVQSAYFAEGDIRLLYLSAGDGTSADFRIYYEDTDTFMDFLQFKGTDGKFIMPVRYQAQIKIPDNYTGSFLPWGDKVISCYIYTELTDNPITVPNGEEQEVSEEETEETETVTEPVRVEDLDEEVEFYLLYAMNNEGQENFYLYDYVEGTYQRYVERDTSYELDQSYFKYKDIAHQRFTIMCILIGLLVVAVFCIINLIIRNRELQADLEGEDGDESDEKQDQDEDSGEEKKEETVRKEEPKKNEKSEKTEKPIKPEKKEKPVKKEKPIKKEETVKKEKPAPVEKAEEQQGTTEKEPEIDTASLEEKIIGQLQETREEEPVRPRKPSNFKMINLSREPEPTGLDDDFEFEFINLDDD